MRRDKLSENKLQNRNDGVTPIKNFMWACVCVCARARTRACILKDRKNTHQNVNSGGIMKDVFFFFFVVF